MGPSLDEDLENTLGAESIEQIFERSTPFLAGSNPCVFCDLAEHDAAWRGTVDEARRQGRIVRPHRACADDYCSTLGTQAVGLDARLLTGDPLARTIGSSSASIESRCRLENDEWAAGPAVVQICGELISCMIGETSEGDVDAGRFEALDSSTGNERIRIGDRSHHSGDPSLYEGFGAGSCASGMAARFEGRVCRCASHICTRNAGVVECDDFGMPSSRSLGGPLEDLAVIRYDDATHPWIRGSNGAGSCSQVESAIHEACVAFVVVGCCHGSLVVSDLIGWYPSGTTKAGDTTTDEPGRSTRIHEHAAAHPCSHPDCDRRPWNSTRSASSFRIIEVDPNVERFAGCDRRLGLAPDPARGVLLCD